MWVLDFGHIYCSQYYELELILSNVDLRFNKFTVVS